MGGRGSLQHPRDPRGGALDLTVADPAALDGLLSGRPVRLRSLVRDPAAHAAALRRARGVRDAARLLRDEHGVPAAWLAVGVASWAAPDGEDRAGPVLLTRAEITARTASEDDVSLELLGPATLNPMLGTELHRDYGVTLDPLPAGAAGAQYGAEPTALYDRLRREAAPVPAFAVAHRLLLGTWTDAALRLAADVDAAAALLETSDVVAALAADPDALVAVRQPLAADPAAADRRSPDAEFLVADADAAQDTAVTAALDGRHLAVEGGPGTGRVSTAVNIAAAAAAAGKHVLLLTAKRAAAESVLRRLEAAGLRGLAVDAAAPADARRIATAVANAAHPVPAEPDLGAAQLRLTETRQRLAAHTDALHRERAPWGVSVYAAHTALLGMAPGAATRVRLSGDVLAGLDAAVVEEARRWVAEWAALGGTTLTSVATPWYGARVATAAEADRARALAADLAERVYPAAADALEKALAEAGLAPAAVVPDWRRALDLLAAVEDVERMLSAEVWAAPLAGLVAATADAEWRREHGDRLGWQDRMAARRQARRLWRGEAGAGQALHEALLRAQQVQARWVRRAAGRSAPRTVPGLAAAERRYAALLDGLAELALYLPDRALSGLAPALLDKTLRQLAADPALARLPRLGELSARCSASGLRPLLVDLHTRRVAAELAPEVLRFAWLSSILAEVEATDPVVGGCDGAALRAAAADFRAADRDHLAGTGVRLQRRHAQRLAAAVAAEPAQAAAVRAEDPAAGASGLHRLLAAAPDVALAAAPCWVVSPWLVPDVVPRERRFDLVVVLDAHQVPVAAAVPGLVRADTAVVLGDRRQVPPLPFGAEPGAAPGEDDGVGEATARRLGRGTPSLLDVLAPILPTVTLPTSHRPADERLLAFAAATAYGGALRTIPAAGGADPVGYVPVPHSAGAPGQLESVTAEVQKVVGLVLDHAVRSPEESFGVVTLGAVHAERIAAALRVALVGRPELGDVFRADAPEPFFVKPAAAVAGDVRDAVVFATGLGKTPEGRLPYRFGALEVDGGERLLTTGLTRARRRLTVVTSFGSADLDPARLPSAGPRLLRALLRYVEEPQLRRTPYAEPPPPDALDLDLRHRLRAAGLPVVAEHGVGPRRVAVALAHPADPGRFVLAVETDGPRAAAVPTVRERERLAIEDLAALGWTCYRVFAAEWCRDPQREVAGIRAAYEAACRAADGAGREAALDAGAPRRPA